LDSLSLARSFVVFVCFVIVIGPFDEALNETERQRLERESLLDSLEHEFGFAIPPTTVLLHGNVAILLVN